MATPPPKPAKAAKETTPFTLFRSKGGDAHKAFKEIDTDGSGTLSLDELLAAAERATGKEPPRARMDWLIGKFDGDGDAALTAGEFKDLASYLEHGHRVHDELADAWETVDLLQASKAAASMSSPWYTFMCTVPTACPCTCT